MRIRSLVSLVALSSLAARPAAAQFTSVFTPSGLFGAMTIHTFESLPGGPGATYSSNAGTPWRVTSCDAAGCFTPSGVWGLLSGSVHDVVRISFAVPTTSMGLWFGNDEPRLSFSAHLRAYSGTGLVGTSILAANMNDRADQFLGFNSTTSITSVEFTFVNAAGGSPGLWRYVDDVQFNSLPGAPTSVVPEPATFVLVGSGMLGLAGLVRRRQRAS